MATKPNKSKGVVINWYSDRYDDLPHYILDDLIFGKQVIDDVFGATLDRKGLQYVSFTAVLVNPLTGEFVPTVSTNLPKDNPDLDMLVETLITVMKDKLKEQLEDK